MMTRKLLVWISLLLAVLATVGSLYLSLGLGLKACPLCFYQRTFAMAAMCVLGVCLWVERARPGLACVLALPLVVAGLGNAAFHEYLVLFGVLECPQGLFGFGTAPAQSLAMFSLLAVSVVSGTILGQHEAPRQRSAEMAVLIVLGGLLAWTCVASSPPVSAAPNQPYDPVEQPLEMCRPAFPTGD